MRRLLDPVFGAYSAAVLLSVALLFLPFVLLMPTLALRRAFGRAAVKAGFALCGMPLRVRGLEHLPEGPCIVVSNHASYLDGPLLTAALPGRFTFVVQHRAGHWPLAGRIIKGMGVTFVHRESSRDRAGQTRGLIRRLQTGQSLTMFPEGTFEPPPGLLPFRKGAFMIATHAGVPVVPAVIRGSRQAFPEFARALRWHPLSIEVFAPVTAEGDHRHAIDSLRRRARATILAASGEPDRGNGGADD